ncbi:MAG: prolyl oligopeptidase family serine peptidase, partial [Chlamydiota bacterium]
MTTKLIHFFIAFLIVTASSYGESEGAPCSETGDCDVGVKTLVFFDKSRERPIITEIYYPPERSAPSLVPTSTNFKLLKEKRNAPIPTGDGKLPLIILSHGHQGDRYGHAWLQEILAANGYIVAVPDHFGNTHYMQRAEDSLKRWDRPKDVTFLIDQLLEDPLLKQHIDPNKIGFIGYSRGGLTGIWLAGGIANNYPTPNMTTSSFIELDEGTSESIIKNIDFSKAKKSYEDKRIKAEFLMAPSYGFAFSPEGLSSIDIPIMIVGAENDSITPIKHNAQFYADNIKSSAIKIMPGKAGHYVFLNTEAQDEKKTLPPYLTKDDPSVDRSKIHEEVANMALKFFDKYLKG